MGFMIALAEDRTGSVVYVLVVTLVAALGGLLFGYDTAVISGAIGYLKDYFKLDPSAEGFAAACALAGCAAGAGFAGFLSDRFGRKKVLILAALAFFISAIGTALPRTLTEYIVFRFLGGLGIGAASITSPMYIAEITPFRIRGRMVSLNQFAIVSGILIVYFVNYFIVNHGLSVDQKTVQFQVATGGRFLDAKKVHDYLDNRVGQMVDLQIEQFFLLTAPQGAQPRGGGRFPPRPVAGGRTAPDRGRRRAAFADRGARRIAKQMAAPEKPRPHRAALSRGGVSCSKARMLPSSWPGATLRSRRSRSAWQSTA